ncbi:FBP domain-containing protein [Microbacterium sp. C5A9]|uniref:FBP domain-containing protein n=1 Tax=Microbacterium sp. C5A9 TaxID=2736663 RepID=UPI001F5161CB|nr:FBP domain-containing protein [Microbacterium sp. C5A9]MCI1019044.1 FBP domain-containing protein [Microbacterium sp. C5A9]
MRPIDERTLRASFLNASRKEVSDLTLPPGFADLDVEKLDYLGWVDPKLPRRAYVVTWIDDVATGVVLQRAEQRVVARAQCSWCEDVTLRNDVQLYVARKAGPAGRKGDTVGTLVCAEFGCSQNVRILPPLAYEGYDRELARELRIVKLQEHVAAFIGAVKG